MNVFKGNVTRKALIAVIVLCPIILIGCKWRPEHNTYYISMELNGTQAACYVADSGKEYYQGEMKKMARTATSDYVCTVDLPFAFKSKYSECALTGVNLDMGNPAASGNIKSWSCNINNASSNVKMRMDAAASAGNVACTMTCKT